MAKSYQQFSVREQLGVLVSSLAAAGIVVRVAVAVHTAMFPFQLDYEEGNVLNAANRIAHGQTPYPEPGHFPYVFNPYGPLGYLLAAIPVKVFGLSLFAPRLLVIVSTIAVVALIAALVRRFGGLWRHGLVVGFWYLCTPASWHWTSLLRVDYPAVALSLSGVYLIAVMPRAIVGPAVVLACALLTKHSVLAGAVTCSLALLIERRWKSVLAMWSLIALIVTAGIVASGGAVMFHLLSTHPDPYSFSRVVKAYGMNMAGALMALGVLAYSWLEAGAASPWPRLPVVYLAVAAATALTIGKLGSDLNHFLELNAAIAILTGVALSRLEAAGDRAQILLSMGLLIMGFGTMLWQWQHPNTLLNADECQKAYGIIRTSPGDRVLSSDTTAAVLSGKPVLVSNPFVYTQLEPHLQWSNGTVAQLAEQQYFDLIAIGGEAMEKRSDSELWSEAAMAAVARRYVVAERFECSPILRAIYVRATPLPAQTAAPGGTSVNPPPAGGPGPR